MAEIIEEKALRNKNYVFRDRAHAGELLARKLGPYVEPAAIIVAIPTASKNALELVSPYVDEIFCLNFRETTVFAVADAYQEWHDLTDREVLELLKK
ncbi:MAG: hypothetical protein EPN24_02905 [Candidatus Methanoperedens sp.]|nr:MAG: hypothetical protein EPN24_02905 [Candidatus Methanoperedens sp.]